jgi:hypothetical protein
MASACKTAGDIPLCPEAGPVGGDVLLKSRTVFGSDQRALSALFTSTAAGTRTEFLKGTEWTGEAGVMAAAEN